jgi:ATP-binding cassette subfamily B (MDR/TAP) protein 1
MSLEPVFAQQFDSSLDEALQTGVRGAFITGLGYGVANALIYLSEGTVPPLLAHKSDY